ncbi:MAG TPA: YqeG family HAD IIIA-type phosphatase [Oscillatoriaceae cyanobacterium]
MRRHPAAARHYGELLKPTMRVASVLDIDLDWLRAQGIKGFIFDLDDTLVHALAPHAEEKISAFITQIRTEFEIYIVSNNFSHQRVDVAARHLEMRFVARAKKPSRRFFRHALAEMGLQADQVAIVGDQLFTDVLGGNRLGAVTVLVDPLSREHKWHRRVMRTLEHQLLQLGGSRYHSRHPAREPAAPQSTHDPHR